MLHIQAQVNTVDNGQIEAMLEHVNLGGGGHQIAMEMVMLMFHVFFEVAYQNQVKKIHQNYDAFTKEVADDVASMVITALNNMGPAVIEGLTIESVRRSMDKIRKEVNVIQHPKDEIVETTAEPVEENNTEEPLPSNEEVDG